MVRLEVATCDERWMGTGFAIAPNRIVTAAHVAAGAVSIGVQGEGVITTARVVDYDKDADVALLQSRDPLPKSLTVANKHAPLGSALALLGFPDAVTDLRVTQGIVSGVDASVDYGPPTNTSLTHVLATDAAINGGNSGGPALDHAGQVIGLVTGKHILNIDETPAEGTGYVVPSDQLIPRLDAWKEKAPAPAGPGCDGAPGGANAAGPVVDVKVASADAQDIARSLATHGGAINTGEYQVAWQFFTAREQRSLASYNKWVDGVRFSLWTNLSVESADVRGDTAATVVRLRTTQDAAHGPSGQVCSDWNLTYTMKRSGAAWLIDNAKSTSAPAACV